MAKGLPILGRRITDANFADKAVAKNGVLALTLPEPYNVFQVNVHPHDRGAHESAKVGLAQALQEDDTLARFAAQVPSASGT